jgi:hypothetical protein
MEGKLTEVKLLHLYVIQLDPPKTVLDEPKLL